MIVSLIEVPLRLDVRGNRKDVILPGTLKRVSRVKHRRDFGTDLLDLPLDTWPEHYPNVPQARFLIEQGVRTVSLVYIAVDQSRTSTSARCT